MPSGWTTDTEAPTILRGWEEGDGVPDMAIIVVAVVAFVFVVAACCWFIVAGKKLVRNEEKAKSTEGANLIGSHPAADHTEPASAAASPEQQVMAVREHSEQLAVIPQMEPAADVAPPTSSGFAEYSQMDNLPPTQFSNDNQQTAIATLHNDPSLPQQEQVEYRIDPEDGKLYTLEDFEQEYGDEGRQRWDSQAATSEYRYVGMEEEEEVQLPEQPAPIVYSEDF